MRNCDTREAGKPNLCQGFAFSVNGGASLFFIAVPTLSTKPGELGLNRRQQSVSLIQIKAVAELGRFLHDQVKRTGRNSIWSSARGGLVYNLVQTSAKRAPSMFYLLLRELLRIEASGPVGIRLCKSLQSVRHERWK